MKSAILGLRKRETYDELINDLNHDPIERYPDRTASQIENSNYLSQLRGGIEQMIIQSDNVMREKQKELLLREEAGNQSHSHHEHVIRENQWRHHVPPDEPMPEADEFHTPLRDPVGEPREYAPDHDTPVDTVRSRSNRKYTTKHERSKPDTPIIQDATQTFNIGTPRSRSPRKRKSKIAHDVDSAAAQAHAIIIDDEEMKAVRDDELREHYVEASRLMLQSAQNQSIDDIMTGRGDKRREENANPKPAQPKAKTTGWTQEGTRWTPNEPIPKSPPQKAPRGRPPNQPEAEPKSKPEPKPRGRPPKQPEAEPKSTPASSSTDTPYAKAQAKAKAAQESEASRTKAKPVKKETKQKPKHETEMVVLDNYNQWNKKGKGFLIDQIQKRPGIIFTKDDAKEKNNKKKLIELLLKFDGKI